MPALATTLVRELPALLNIALAGERVTNHAGRPAAEPNDYDLGNTSLGGNRDITESHFKKIAEGIRSTDRPHPGTVTVAPAHEDVEIEYLQKVGTRRSRWHVMGRGG